RGASFRMRCFSFRQLVSDSNDARISHLLSEAFRSLKARGWPPIALKTGGIKRNQPTSASATAWRAFIRALSVRNEFLVAGDHGRARRSLSALQIGDIRGADLETRAHL